MTCTEINLANLGDWYMSVGVEPKAEVWSLLRAISVWSHRWPCSCIKNWNSSPWLRVCALYKKYIIIFLYYSLVNVTKLDPNLDFVSKFWLEHSPTSGVKTKLYKQSSLFSFGTEENFELKFLSYKEFLFYDFVGIKGDLFQWIFVIQVWLSTK